MIALIAVVVFHFVFAFVCIAELSSRWLPTSTPVVGQFPFSFQLTRTACLVEAIWLQLQSILSDSVPCLTMLEWRTCFGQVDSSHCVGFALLFSKTHWTLVFRYSIPRSKEFGSSRCSPGQASIRLKIGLQCRLKSLQICFGNISFLKSRNGLMGTARGSTTPLFICTS
jgi:hypothetical protein